MLGRTYFFRDLYLWIFPQRVRLVDLVHSEGLPLWDPYLHGGQPFLGEISNAAFYPSAILEFVLPPVVPVSLSVGAAISGLTVLIAAGVALRFTPGDTEASNSVGIASRSSGTRARPASCHA